MNMFEDVGADLLGQYSDALQTMANDCRDDAELRAKVDSEPRAVFADRDLPFPDQSDVRVVRNTADVFYMAIPPDPNAAVSDASLEQTAGGSRGVGHPNNCASTSSTIPSCLGTYGSATGMD